MLFQLTYKIVLASERAEVIFCSVLLTSSFPHHVISSPSQEQPKSIHPMPQQDTTGPGTHHGPSGERFILATASKAAYWGSSVLTEVNLVKSFEVQSDSCLKPLLANKKETQFRCL